MHDANGKPLKVGDRVVIEAEITGLYPSEEYCNVSLCTTLGRRPDGCKETISTMNTGMLVKVESETEDAA